MGLLSLLPSGAVRALRKFMLSQGRRMGSHRMLAISKSRAIHAIRDAARLSPAYRTLLQEHGVDPAQIGRAHV